MPFHHFGAEYYVDAATGFYTYSRPYSMAPISRTASPSTTTASLSGVDTEPRLSRRRSSPSLPRRSSCPTSGGKPRRKRTQKFSYGPGTDELYGYLTGTAPPLMSAPLRGYFPSDAVLRAHEELERGSRASLPAQSLEKMLLKSPSSTPEPVDPVTGVDNNDNATSISSSSSQNNVPSLVICVSDSDDAEFDDDSPEQPEVEIEKNCPIVELQGRKVGVLGGGVKLGSAKALRRRGTGMGDTDEDPKSSMLSVSTREEDLWSNFDDVETSTPLMSPKVSASELPEGPANVTNVDTNLSSTEEATPDPESKGQDSSEDSSSLCPTECPRPVTPPAGIPAHAPIPTSTTSFSWADESADDDDYFAMPAFGSDVSEKPKALSPVAEETEETEEEKADETTSSSSGSTVMQESPKPSPKPSAWTKAPGTSLFSQSASKVIIVSEKPTSEPEAASLSDASSSASSAKSTPPRKSSKLPIFPPEPSSSPRPRKTKQQSPSRPKSAEPAPTSEKIATFDSAKNTQKANRRSRSIKQLASGAQTIRAAPEIYSRLGYQLSPEAAREVEFLRVVESKRLKKEAKAAAAAQKPATTPESSQPKPSFSGSPVLTPKAKLVATTLFQLSQSH
ncbi:hypothetical protein FRC03_003750 [Tulasnella sp. 419]|nr:hypothetical protein FRC03_003750 [Tulasnella sp. 419]